jgi:UDP-glucose 4-epimerase
MEMVGKKMKCLLLGGGGFQGSHLCDALLKAGYSVLIFEKKGIRRDNIAHALSRIKLIEGDFSDKRQLEEAVQGVDFIFHLISTTLPSSSNENMPYDISTNVVPTLDLLELSRKNGVKKVVFFSSGGTVYGIPSKLPISEEHPTDPICSYGIHKLTVEKYLNLCHELYGADYAVLRVSNPYGERQNVATHQGAVAVFSHKALIGEPIEIWGDGSVVRDYIYVADVVRAALNVLDHKGPHRVFNIGSGIGMSLKDVVSEIEKVVGHSLDVRYRPSRPLDVPANILDIGLARNELHWEPEISFEAGLARTLMYLRDSLPTKQ